MSGWGRKKLDDAAVLPSFAPKNHHLEPAHLENHPPCLQSHHQNLFRIEARFFNAKPADYSRPPLSMLQAALGSDGVRSEKDPSCKKGFRWQYDYGGENVWEDVLHCTLVDELSSATMAMA